MSSRTAASPTSPSACVRRPRRPWPTASPATRSPRRRPPTSRRWPPARERGGRLVRRALDLGALIAATEDAPPSVDYQEAELAEWSRHEPRQPDAGDTLARRHRRDSPAPTAALAVRSTEVDARRQGRNCRRRLVDSSFDDPIVHPDAGVTGTTSSADLHPLGPRACWIADGASGSTRRTWVGVRVDRGRQRPRAGTAASTSRWGCGRKRLDRVVMRWTAAMTASSCAAVPSTRASR